MNEVIRDLAQPFPAKYVHTNPSGGGSYVKHHVVEQRLIQVLGTPPNFKMVEILRGDVDGFTAKNGTVYPDLANVIVGVVARMTVTIGDDVREVEECGDCEQPHNWKTDGQRLKDAMSDAYKRCAMRLGCGLHLWSQNEFFLFDELSKSEGGGSPVSGESREQAHVNPPSSESSPEGTTASQQNGDTSPSAVPSGEPPYSETVRAIGSYIGGDDTRRSIVKAKINALFLSHGLTPPTKLESAADYASIDDSMLSEVLSDITASEVPA